ncbi:YbaY family lipoprotein [Paracoccus aminophilus]|uniref:Lipoprotein n=1 Tax=Paracoccus aminophilus JCM 7686 TaxID=1367847 RepID=S5XUH9_PARAH|nr:YbaY family lipoprotein [Paracoccus aminophilus]AGT11144.1 hypothetical protein JCM7686_pAMI5p078 [Paracoccus aminophilus JCM 7686]
MFQRVISAPLVAAAVLSLAACEAPAAKTETVSGSVIYRERMALPPGAEVSVQLVDVSRADAPSITLAETTIQPKSQVPIPYVLSYDPARIESGHSYALQARISDQGKLLFINTTHHPYVPGEAKQADILVERTR